MNEQNLFEKPKIKNRFRELATLAGFTVAVGILSVITMDVLVYPITSAAVRNPGFFTVIIKLLLVLLPLAAVIIYSARKASILRKEGFSAGKIIRLILFRPVYHIAIALIVVMFTTVIIAMLYILLHYNYYLLYRFSL